MNEFSPETARAIGDYVYALIDTRRGGTDPRRFFYVGKGRGQRCFQHARAEVGWRMSSGEPNPKLDTIRRIRKATGAPPAVEIVRHGLSHDAALELEAVLIKLLRTDPSRRADVRTRDAACNRTSGRGAREYCLTAAELEGMYSHPLPEADLAASVLLVNLSGGARLAPFPTMRSRDLPRRVLRYWRIAPERAARVDYIAGVYRQLIRVVFRVEKRGDGSARFRRFDTGRMAGGRRNVKTGFSGERCAELETLWCNRRIVNTRGETVTKFARQQGWKLVGRNRPQPA